MVNIAVVEDDKNEASMLLDCLERYKQEKESDYAVEYFGSAVSFLEKASFFDLVFMDIMMPHMTGMEAAVCMRKSNSRTLLIFITHTAQFAIRGYEVDALDYVMKPVSYERVTMKLGKALRILQASKGIMLSINDLSGTVYISSDEVYYIDVRGHKRTFHTQKGDYCDYGSLTDIEAQLKTYNFMRCNACFLLNPNYIHKINGYIVKMANGDELKISQPKRKAFVDNYTNYLGQRKC